MVFDKRQIQSLIYTGEDIKINKHITIKHPKVKEILDYGEDRYWNLIYHLTSTSYAFRVALYDDGKDYEEVSDFEIFIKMILNVFTKEDLSIIFKGIDYTIQDLYLNTNTNQIVLSKDGVMIDEAIYKIIVDILREMHLLKREYKKSGNASTKKALIEIERQRIKRLEVQRKYDTDYDNSSQMLYHMSSLINNSECKFTYESIKHIPIYIFKDALLRINKIKEFDNIMTGIYSGTVDSSKIDFEKIHWCGKIN